MLKLLRKGAIDNPWMFRTIMFLIALTFVISMGWFGISGRRDPYVAQVDQTRISRIKYERYRENAYRLYRDLFKENFKEDLVKQFVINNLVDRELWLKLARGMHLAVGDGELRESIMNDSTFHDTKGRFDPERYEVFLSRSRLTAPDFEESVREDLLIEKTRRILLDGIVLTPQEIAEAVATVTDPQLTAEARGQEEGKAIRDAHLRKQERVVASALGQVRSSAKIEINHPLL